MTPDTPTRLLDLARQVERLDPDAAKALRRAHRALAAIHGLVADITVNEQGQEFYAIETGAKLQQAVRKVRLALLDR